MAGTATCNAWTHRNGTDEPKAIGAVMASLKWWLVRYEQLTPEAVARSGRLAGFYAEADREGGTADAGDSRPVTLPGDAPELIVTKADLDGVLEGLPGRQREALVGHLVGGQSLRRVGRDMGISATGVSRLCGKGLRRGARMLSGERRS